MQPTLGRVLMLGLGSIAALLLLDAGLSYRNTRKLREDSAWVAHSPEVLALTGEVLSTLKDAETGQRGYLITGEDRFLGTYHDALARFDGRMARLREATVDNPGQQSRIGDLGRISASKLDSLEQDIDLWKRRGFEAVRAFIRAGQGKEEMDAARRLVTEIEEVERHLLAERRRRFKRTYRVAAVTGPLASLVGLAAILAFTRLLRRHLVARGADAAAVHEQRELLRATLQSVPDGLIATDAAGRVVSINPIAEALTGWELRGREWVADRGRLQHRRRGHPPAGREPRRAGACRRPDRRPGQPHRADRPRWHPEAHRGQRRPDPDAGTATFPGASWSSATWASDVGPRMRSAVGSGSWQFVTDHAPVMIAHCDTEHRYKFANRPFVARFGLQPADIIGMTIPEVLGEEAYARIKPYAEAVLTGEHQMFEIEVPYQQVGMQQMQCAFDPELDAEGRVVGYIAAVINVTEHKRVKRALLEAESRLSAIVDHSPVTIFLKDREGRYPLVNRRFEEMARIEGVEGPFLGKTDAELLPPDLAERFRRDDLEILESKQAKVYEEGDEVGRTGPIALTTKFPLLDESGDAYAVCGIRLDITERKRAEERQRSLWEAAAVLLSADDPDAMMRGVFDRIAPHFGLDAYFHFRVVEAGDALRLVLRRRARGGGRGHRPGGVRPGRERHGGPAAPANRGDPRPAVRRPDGPVRQVLRRPGVRLSPAAGRGHPAGDALVRQPKSGRLRRRGAGIPAHRQPLRHLRPRAAAAHRAAPRGRPPQGRLPGDAAHELRNPLAPIRNALLLMAHRDSDGDEHDHEAERAMAERQVTHLARLVDDLMDVARINKGKIELRKEVVELAPIVAHSVESARAAIEGRGLHLSVSLPEGRSAWRPTPPVWSRYSTTSYPTPPSTPTRAAGSL